MSAFTYTQLVDALQDWPEDDNAEYVANIPRLISLGENRAIRDLNLDIFDYLDSNLLIEQNDTVVAKPEDMIAPRFLWLIDPATSVRTPLHQRSFSFLQRYWPDLVATSVPKYYNDLSEVAFELRPTANADYAIECLYIRRPLGLSATIPNTWLGDKAGDLLFAATLMEAEHFIKADDRYEDMKRKFYQELLPTARAELRRLIRTGDYTPYQPAAMKAQ